jgi:two-component system, NarL family, sensor histidine kinase DegS
MMLSEGSAELEIPDHGDDLVEICKEEIRNSRKKIKEIELLIEQSQGEVSRLAQKNSQLSSKLQQIKSQFTSVPREDIREIYDASLDAQQRLFVMRGQVEKLASDQSLVEHYSSILERVCGTLESIDNQDTNAGRVRSPAANTVEMMIQAQESERQRLARQMHDGPAQALSNFILQTEIAMRLFDMDQSKARDELKNLMAAASTTLKRVRDFIFELRPMMLDDLGLGPTLKRYIESLKEQTGVDIRLNFSGLEQRLESYLEVLIFRAVQELIGNALKYSQATQVNVRIDSSDFDLRVNVEDNGKGFIPDALTEQSGMGLKVIRDRVEKLGGTIEIHSVPGQGSHISFQIPATKVAVFA